VNDSLRRAGTWARLEGICREKERNQATQTGRTPVQEVDSAARATATAAEGFWPKGWWSLVDFKIGIIRRGRP
jgi:hypothetical protein